MECKEKFFENNFFKFGLTDLPDKGFYNCPNILVYLKELPSKNNIDMWQHYCDGLFVHELCHAFRNFLNKDLEKLKKKDHDLTFKEYVSLSDLHTEIEVLTLEEFILRTIKSNIFPNKELYQSIEMFNKQVPEKYKQNDLLNLVKKSERRWNTIGIAGLEEQYHGMIDYLESTAS